MPLARASLVCQPIAEYVHEVPLFLLVDTHGLVCKCDGQALTRGIWPASFVILSKSKLRLHYSNLCSKLHNPSLSHV